MDNKTLLTLPSANKWGAGMTKYRKPRKNLLRAVTDTVLGLLFGIFIIFVVLLFVTDDSYTDTNSQQPLADTN